MGIAEQREYLRQRKLGQPAKIAFMYAKTRIEFNRLESSGLARLITKPDDCPDLSFLDQDCFADVRKSEYERANRDGVCGLIGEYRVDKHSPWIEADAVWGFIGDDWKDSGYDADIMRSTIDQLNDTLQHVCPTCGQPVKK